MATAEEYTTTEYFIHINNKKIIFKDFQFFKLFLLFDIDLIVGKKDYIYLI